MDTRQTVSIVGNSIVEGRETCVAQLLRIAFPCFRQPNYACGDHLSHILWGQGWKGFEGPLVSIPHRRNAFGPESCGALNVVGDIGHDVSPIWMSEKRAPIILDELASRSLRAKIIISDLRCCYSLNALPGVGAFAAFAVGF